MPAKAMRRPDLSLVLDSIRNKRQRIGVAGELARIFPGERLRTAVRDVEHEVEHHLAHLASAFLVPPFDDAGRALARRCPRANHPAR